MLEGVEKENLMWGIVLDRGAASDSCIYHHCHVSVAALWMIGVRMNPKKECVTLRVAETVRGI
jgi:hypothetical protein